MLRYGYFDSDIIGIDDEGMPIFDRAELSDLFALLFSSLVSDGVLALPATCFKIQAAGNGLSIERLPGFGMVKGHFCYDNESDIMTLTAPQSYSRIDRVVMRLNLLERMVEIIIKTGAEAARPKPPELVRPAAGDYFELCLAEITLAPRQTTLTQSSITDTRANSAVCGFITQLIDHLDTEVFFDQLNAFYQEFTIRTGESYNQFTEDAETYLNNLELLGDTQLKEIKKEFQAWFENARETLASVENGEMLAEVSKLLKDLYRMATDDDIDRIIAGEYVDEDEEGSIFETASNQDIDDIIAGTYTDAPEEGNTEGTSQNMTEIVNNAFKEK